MKCKSYQITYLSWKIPDNAIAISRIMKAPQKNPSLKVVQGDPCLSPKGGTLKNKLGWFSVEICKYKPVYKAHDLL